MEYSNRLMVRIDFITGSRAEFGILLPLIKTLKTHPCFDVGVLVFGTHLDPSHGHTINEIVDEGILVRQQFPIFVKETTNVQVVEMMADLMKALANYWVGPNARPDLVIALGDRYEMQAAVQAAAILGIEVAHIHGGETTLGAIDNMFRHQITLASKIHFPAHSTFAARISQILDSNESIYPVGSLSVEAISKRPKSAFEQVISDLSLYPKDPYILCTLHPETFDSSLDDQKKKAEIFSDVILALPYQAIVSLPNADVFGDVIRETLFHKLSDCSRIVLTESLGVNRYYTLLSEALFLLGNSSSGIIEAASFKKFVINLGERQKGRLTGNNVFHLPFDRDLILSKAKEIEAQPFYEGENPYGGGDTSVKILNILLDKYGCS